MSGSSAASGSSNSNNRGSMISARAKRDPLALAAGHFTNSRVCQGPDFEPVEHAPHALVAVGSRQVTGAQTVPDVGGHVEMRKQRVLLEEVSDARAGIAARTCSAS